MLSSVVEEYKLNLINQDEKLITLGDSESLEKRFNGSIIQLSMIC